MTDLARLVVRLEAQSDKYRAELQKANAQLEKFSNNANSSLRSIGAAVDLIKFDVLARYGKQAALVIKNLALSSFEGADALIKMKQATGISVEELGGLKFAASQSGVEFDALATGIKKFSKNVSDAAGNVKGEAANAFEALGISVKNVDGTLKGSSVLIGEVSDKFAGYEDGANKTALAMQLFGKAGADLIPLLNGGSSAIKELSDQARNAGLIVSDEFAASAEVLNDRISLLEQTLTTGIGNAIGKELLPAFDALSERLVESTDNSLILEQTGKTVATILKGITTVVLGTVTGFLKLGNTIGALGASAASVMEGEFRQAAKIIELASEDNLKLEEEYQKNRAAVWTEGGEEVLREVKLTAKLIKAEAPSVSAVKVDRTEGDKLEAERDRAIKTLKDMSQALDSQVVNFKRSSSAVTEYELTLGKLSDQIKLAGEEGKKLASNIIAQSIELEKLNNVDAVSNIDVQILQLTGHLKEATVATFDLQNAQLRASFDRTGDTAGTAKLDQLRDLTVAQAEFNALQASASVIQSELAAQEERIHVSREANIITDVAAMAQIDEARKSALQRLIDIDEKLNSVAASTNNPEIDKGVKEFGLGLERLSAQADTLSLSIKSSIGDALTNTVRDAMKGTEKIGDLFKNLALSILDIFADLAAKNLVASILNSSGGEKGTNILSSLFGSLAGARASGGPVSAGRAYLVNENTPNSEIFIPSTSGRVEPAVAISGSASNLYGAGSSAPSVTVHNYGTPQDVEAQITEDKIILITRDQINKRVPKLVANELSDPYSPVSKSMGSNFQTSRRR